MSYILDALRRADSERERGAVPGLHAQPVPPASAHFGMRAGAKPWVWIVVGVSLGLLVPLAWHLATRDATPEPVSPTAQAPDTAPPPYTAPPPPRTAEPSPAAVPQAPLAVPPAPQPPAMISAREPAQAPKALAPASPATAKAALPTAPPTAPQAAPTARRSTPTASAGTAAAPTQAPASATTTEARVYTLSELPPEIRRQLPTLAISGSMYSENAANRMLIVNGQLLHEGDKPAPELVLERIKLKSAVLKYKEYRYEITY